MRFCVAEADGRTVSNRAHDRAERLPVGKHFVYCSQFDNADYDGE